MSFFRITNMLAAALCHNQMLSVLLQQLKGDQHTWAIKIIINWLSLTKSSFSGAAQLSLTEAVQ